MTVSVDRLPVTVTCFALGDAYLRRLDGLIESVRVQHPRWSFHIGRCLPAPEGGRLAFEHEGGRWQTPLPVPLAGGEDDWRRITRLKGWWIEEVWKTLESPKRLLWLDVEVRLRRPIAFEVEPEAETVAGPWWQDPERQGRDLLTSGVLYLQGSTGGPVSHLLADWRHRCLDEIASLPPRTLPWKDGDQEVLNTLLQPGRPGVAILRLPHDAYCAGRKGITEDDSTVVEHAGV